MLFDDSKRFFKIKLINCEYTNDTFVKFYRKSEVSNLFLTEAIFCIAFDKNDRQFSFTIKMV